MEKKKVSIVLPVYNGEKYLEESILSVLDQSYENIELIIVDDCSTDQTPEIVGRYLNIDFRVKYIKNSINQRLPKSLNIGFDKATGDYYTWTSDDNIYAKNAIESMVNYLEGDYDVKMVYADCLEIDSEGKERGKFELGNPEEIICKNVVGACFMYRMECAKCVGEYDANLFMAEDYDYWIRIAKVGKIAHIPKVLYYYRTHGKSLTSTRCEMAIIQTYRVLEKHFLYLYSTRKGIKQKMFFLEQLEEWGRLEDKYQVRKEIYSVNFLYYLYSFPKHLKEKIIEFKHFCGGKLRKAHK